MSSSIPLKKEYFNTKIASVLDELRQLKEEHNKKLIVNKLKWEQNNLTLHTIEADLVYWEKELPDLSKEFEDVKMLFDKRLVLTCGPTARARSGYGPDFHQAVLAAHHDLRR